MADSHDINMTHHRLPGYSNVVFWYQWHLFFMGGDLIAISLFLAFFPVDSKHITALLAVQWILSEAPVLSSKRREMIGEILKLFIHVILIYIAQKRTNAD